MLSAVEEVQKTGELMSSAAREFASDPCSSAKRGNMVGDFFISTLRARSQLRSRSAVDCGTIVVCLP